jgi:hypothetical protein
MVPLPAPGGMIMLREAVVAIVTLHALPFKVTILSAALALKFVPVKTTVEFLGPEVGAIERIVVDVVTSSLEQLAITPTNRISRIILKYFITIDDLLINKNRRFRLIYYSQLTGNV